MYYSSPPGILIKGITIALFLRSLILVLKTPKSLFSIIACSLMRHADSDKNWIIKMFFKKRPEVNSSINASKMSYFMHLNGFIFVCTLPIKK